MQSIRILRNHMLYNTLLYEGRNASMSQGRIGDVHKFVDGDFMR